MPDVLGEGSRSMWRLMILDLLPPRPNGVAVTGCYQMAAHGYSAIDEYQLSRRSPLESVLEDVLTGACRDQICTPHRNENARLNEAMT